jgi:hypothetical protein
MEMTHVMRVPGSSASHRHAQPSYLFPELMARSV